MADTDVSHETDLLNEALASEAALAEAPEPAAQTAAIQEEAIEALALAKAAQAKRMAYKEGAGFDAKRAAVWETRKDNPDLGPEWDVADPTQIDQEHTK